MPLRHSILPIPCSTEAPLPRSFGGFAEALKRRDEFHGVVSFSHFVPRLEVNPEKRYLIPSSLAKARPWEGHNASSLYPPYPPKKKMLDPGVAEGAWYDEWTSHTLLSLSLQAVGSLHLKKRVEEPPSWRLGRCHSASPLGEFGDPSVSEKKKHENSVAQLLKDGLSRCPIVFEHFRGNHVLAPGKGGFDSSQCVDPHPPGWALRLKPDVHIFGHTHFGARAGEGQATDSLHVPKFP